MRYGIANRDGRPGFKQALRIVETAWQNGIRRFDTAQAYGNSEEILGACFRELLGGRGPEPVVVSKLAPEQDISRIDSVLASVDTSMKALGLERLWGLMLHRETLLGQGKTHLSKVATRLKLEGKVAHFGVSVYSPQMAIKALDMDEIDIIQIPFNVFDQRALEQGVFRLADERGKKVFVRSVYLQGLLLLDPERLPDKMLFARDILATYRGLSKHYRISNQLLALTYVIHKAPRAYIVIGAERPEQVEENALLWAEAKDLNLPDLGSISQGDPKLINPALWPH
jgi:aryl-alcohol dehydrogenase-like predicted oxidoreductase